MTSFSLSTTFISGNSHSMHASSPTHTPMPLEERPMKRMKISDTTASSVIRTASGSSYAHDYWWRELDRMVFEHPDPDNKRDRKEMIGIYISLDNVHTSENAFGSRNNPRDDVSDDNNGPDSVIINYRYRSGMVINEALTINRHDRNYLYRSNGEVYSTRIVEIIRNPFGLVIGLKPFENDAAFVRRNARAWSTHL